MTRAEFEALAAECYDACDSGMLSQKTIEEAIEEYLDAFMTGDCDVLAVIREHSPVEVTAHRTSTVSESWIEDTARCILETIAEDWGEEYGDPDGGGEFDAAAVARHMPAAIALVRAFCAEEPVWKCDRIGAYSYAAEEVEAMTRAHRPDWFNNVEARR